VIGPFGAPAHHQPLGLVDEILELAVVEVRDGERHQ
jgi:hypothetical protein